MGGTALAAPAAAANSNTTDFSFLQAISQRVSGTPSGDAFWIGAGYTPPPSATAPTGDPGSGWRWIPRLSHNKFGELLLTAATVGRPLAAAEGRWGPGFPKMMGARFVRIEPGSPLESCAAVRWPRGVKAAVWENYACSGRVVRFFVRPNHLQSSVRASG